MHVDFSLRLKKLPPNFDIVIPFLKFDRELEKELSLLNAGVISRNKNFFVVQPLMAKPIWAQEWLPNCEVCSFTSKSEAVKILKNQPCLGTRLNSPFNVGLSQSIERELRSLEAKRITYEVPSKFNFRYFVWTLLDDQQLAICREPFAKFPLGWNEFKEDKQTPPNRAYLKLWEALCLGYIDVKSTQSVIDLGSSPGGWTWVLSQQAKKVYSVDKAPLDPKIASVSNVVYRSGDAFLVNPADYNDCDWMFSDIICTPQRLLSLIEKWLTYSTVTQYMCTLKFKGECDFDIIQKFLQIPNSQIIHLYQNKNEVTWIKQKGDS